MSAGYWLLWAAVSILNAALFLGTLWNLSRTLHLLDEMKSRWPL